MVKKRAKTRLTNGYHAKLKYYFKQSRVTLESIRLGVSFIRRIKKFLTT